MGQDNAHPNRNNLIMSLPSLSEIDSEKGLPAEVRARKYAEEYNNATLKAQLNQNSGMAGDVPSVIKGTTTNNS